MGQDAVATGVADAIERLGRLLRSRSYAENLNPAQWEALRYLSRCNRHSNNPTALAAFLGATKGTVSQTVTALERKGLIGKVPRPGQGRSLSIVLTDAGRAVLGRDPLVEVEAAVSSGNGGSAQLADDLHGLLRRLQASNDLRTFGKCRTCRHFRANAPGGDPHTCDYLGAAVTEAEADQICVEHAP